MIAEEVQELAEMQIAFRILPLNGAMMVKMKDRKKFDLGQKFTLDDTLNHHVAQITIPDIGLLHINEVTWMEDACTEALQDMLNDGWRLIAVCPPNAQRRPDYILGRSKNHVVT